MADAGAPPGTLLHDFGDAANRRARIGGGGSAGAGTPSQPGNQPQEAEQAERDENGAPSESRHQHPAEKRSEGRAGSLAGGDDSVANAAVMHGKIARQNFRVGRIGDGFANAENQSQNESDANACMSPVTAVAADQIKNP